MEAPRDTTLEYSSKPLTRLQRKALVGYAKFHVRPPTMGRLLKRTWWMHLLTLALGAGVTFYFCRMDLPIVAALFAGVFAGAVLRDFAYFRVLIRIWPVLEMMLDWKRINELLADDGGHKPSPEGGSTTNKE